ncbi:permease-like cell division protein FtsX [Capnocytophaga gingivalis]|uniref:cell division protein FtsX n=1 Tax=Capnocytophaga gingivalis TaxID=1017 RepID=UPI0028D76D66|nr:permease-like cell division protein FtsX [Capnocytophaga gingivalis]
MHTRTERYNRRKLISSYFSVTLSITLVLFLLGLLGFLLINVKNLTDSYKEHLIINVFLKDTAKEADIEQLQKSLSLASYTKQVEFISKEQAAQSFSEELGEDFISFIGDNPLGNSFDLALKADYVTPQKMEEVKESILQNASVKEVNYDKDSVKKIHSNIQSISLVILAVSAIFTVVAMLLINASIRLSVYSKRFIIKTMQLVGATKAFIRRPFIITNIWLGILSAILACAALAFTFYAIDQSWPEWGLIMHYQDFIWVGAALFLIGVFLSWISTYFAAQRFLNLHTDELYY